MRHIYHKTTTWILWGLILGGLLGWYFNNVEKGIIIGLVMGTGFGLLTGSLKKL